jgi:hypothetical protein
MAVRSLLDGITAQCPSGMLEDVAEGIITDMSLRPRMKGGKFGWEFYMGVKTGHSSLDDRTMRGIRAYCEYLHREYEEVSFRRHVVGFRIEVLGQDGLFGEKYI